MIIDKENEYSDGQAITADAASTNIIDHGSAYGELGALARPLRGRVQVDTTFDNLTSLTVTLQTATDAAFTSPVGLASKTILAAALVAGAQFDFGIIPEGALRYTRFYYDVNGTNPAAGALSAFLEVYEGEHGDITSIPGQL